MNIAVQVAHHSLCWARWSLLHVSLLIVPRPSTAPGPSGTLSEHVLNTPLNRGVWGAKIQVNTSEQKAHPLLTFQSHSYLQRALGAECDLGDKGRFSEALH